VQAPNNVLCPSFLSTQQHLTHTSVLKQVVSSSLEGNYTPTYDFQHQNQVGFEINFHSNLSEFQTIIFDLCQVRSASIPSNLQLAKWMHRLYIFFYLQQQQVLAICIFK
jgi:hypothetical protein